MYTLEGYYVDQEDMYRVCRHCNGTGEEPSSPMDNPEPCEDCYGRGIIDLHE